MSWVLKLLMELDDELLADRRAMTEGAKPPVFKRRKNKAVAAVEPYRVEPERTPVSDKPQTLREWMAEQSEHWRSLLRVRTVPDFIDVERYNTVMASYGDNYIRLTEEAKALKNEAEDLEEGFDLWWTGKILEARKSAAKAKPPVKITSDSGALAYAKSVFGDEYRTMRMASKEARRKADFLSSIKFVYEKSAAVLSAAGQSFRFEWHTAGGLVVEDEGNTFRGLPARRIGVVPGATAVAKAFKSRST